MPSNARKRTHSNSPLSEDSNNNSNDINETTTANKKRKITPAPELRWNLQLKAKVKYSSYNDPYKYKVVPTTDQEMDQHEISKRGLLRCVNFKPNSVTGNAILGWTTQLTSLVQLCTPIPHGPNKIIADYLPWWSGSLPCQVVIHTSSSAIMGSMLRTRDVTGMEDLIVEDVKKELIQACPQCVAKSEQQKRNWDCHTFVRVLSIEM